MKRITKAAALLFAAVLLYGCADKAQSSVGITDGEKTALAASAHNAKVGYGQGYEVDGDNRPVGAVRAQEQYGALGGVFIGGKDEKKIYLTFDEGYENGYTADILDTLKEKDVKATFYVTLDYVKTNPELVKRMIDEGHNVGNHTCTHPSLPDCSDDEFFEEINRLEQYISDNFGGYKTKTLRPPMGEFSERTLSLAKNMGYDTVLWSFAYNDWNVDNQPEKTAAFERITKATHNGAIYLLHAVSKTNTELLPEVIDYWRNEGYEVGAI